MVKEDLTPRKIMTKNAFENAIRIDMALGGSTNTTLHIPAIAHEAGIDLSIDTFDRISRSTPHVCNMLPGGPTYMEDLDAAGGIPGVLSRFTKMLKPSRTVSGRSIIDHAKAGRVGNDEVIRTLKNAYHQEGGIAVLSGNLAPDGCVVKQTAVSDKMKKFEGTAIVFDSEEESMKAILGEQDQARACHRDPVRRAQGRAWHAGDAFSYLGHFGHGAGRVGCPADGRQVLGRHARPLYRPYLSGGRRGRTDRDRAERGQDRPRHPEPQTGSCRLSKAEIKKRHCRMETAGAEDQEWMACPVCKGCDIREYRSDRKSVEFPEVRRSEVRNGEIREKSQISTFQASKFVFRILLQKGWNYVEQTDYRC